MKILFSLFIFMLSKEAFSATITGMVTEYANKKITFTKIDYDTRKDTVVHESIIKSNGAFYATFTFQESIIVSIAVAEKQVLHATVHPQDNISLIIGKESIQVKGSSETELLIEYEKYRKGLFDKFLKPVYDSSASAEKVGNKEKLEFWNKQQTYASDKYKQELSAWAMKPSFLNSFGAIHASLRWHPDNDGLLMDSMLAYYKRTYPKNTYTTQLENKVLRTKRTALGAMAPDFSSLNQYGMSSKLSDTKAKYILLDFWASWCPPCRQESPTLVRLFNKYKNKGFVIVSVSVDDNKENWIRAIEKDGFIWPQVSDLKGWQSPSATLYNVSAIPTSFLLDENRRIIAKNLRGVDLEKKLEELLP